MKLPQLYTPFYTPSWPQLVLNIGLVLIVPCLLASVVGFIAGAQGALLASGVFFLADIAVMMVVIASALILENLHRHKNGKPAVSIRASANWEGGSFLFSQLMNCAYFCMGIYCAYLAFSLAVPGAAPADVAVPA